MGRSRGAGVVSLTSGCQCIHSLGLSGLRFSLGILILGYDVQGADVEMAQPAKSLPCKHKNLNLIPRTCVKKNLGVGTHTQDM